MSISKIKELIENEEFEFYGIRKDDAEYSVGDTCENSHSWRSDGTDNGELDGTCAIGVKAGTIESVIAQSKEYYGSHLYLIASDRKEMGEDQGEYIMSDAVVIAVL